LSERKTFDEDGYGKKEIFIGSKKHPSSNIDKKVLNDLKQNQTINIDEIIEMTISKFEEDLTLQKEAPEDLKMLRDQWKAFSLTFKKITSHNKHENNTK
jgi:sRNA-binding carbon storage regulator CsrA